MTEDLPLYTNSLTEREKEVLRLIDAGLSNTVIAEELVLSYHTVTWYNKQIFNKLGVNRRTQAVAVARSLGILDGGTGTFRPQHNLPTQSTSFVGRENEILKISDLLDDAYCRLVTLVGPGGTGKTCLALKVVAEKLDEYADGVSFVPLQPLTSPDKIALTIAKSLGINHQTNRQDPRRPLFDYLREKSVLLLLDNFEHLLAGRQIIPDLLAAAPHIKIVVTSRESLNLREEFLFNVGGLSYPEDDQAAPNGSFQAIELFAQRARQVCPDFSLEDAYSDVSEICRLVVGMPLAIELAASWLKSLSSKEIVAEIQKGLDGLATTIYNMPDRHRSMWATFTASWRSLNDEERAVFKRMSIFRGGCASKAAYQITGANRWILQSLADKSFIRRDVGKERFDIHELLRQYGEYQLKQSETAVFEIQNQHCTYYMELLAQHRDNIFSQHQIEMMQELEPDLDNIRMAWQWAVEQSRVDFILKSVHTLAYFHVFRGRFLEEVEAFESAIKMIEGKVSDKTYGLTVAVLLSYLGWVYIRIGESELAEASFLRSKSLYRRTNAIPPKGLGTEPLTGLAMLACIRGEYDQAEWLGEATCKVSRERDDPLNQQLGEYAIISAYINQGRYEDAQELAEHWLKMNKDTGGKWNLAVPLNTMGDISRLLGNYEQAREYCKESYEIRQEFNDPQGMAAAQNFLGITAVLEGDTKAAKRYFKRSYDLYKKVGDRGGVGYALCGLGTIASTTGDYEMARRHFYRGLRMVIDIQYMPVIFLALIGFAELMIATEKQAQGIEILTMVCQHEQCGHEAKDRVNQILNRVFTDLDPETYQAACMRGQALHLWDFLTTLMSTFTF